MGIFDGVLGGQGGLTKSEKDMYNNHMEHIRVQESEMLRQKYEAQALMNQTNLMQSSMYSQNLAQSMAQTKNAMMQNVYSQMASQQPIKPFNPNELEAFKIPLSQLVTLWQAKYGDEWVETFDEQFWSDAMSRLKTADKLETARHWFRIKEDA